MAEDHKKVSSEEGGSPLKTFSVVIAIAAFFAFISWKGYGTHVEDSDPVHGGGQVVHDFSPTRQERDQHGILTFTIITVIGSVGVFQGLKERKK